MLVIQSIVTQNIMRGNVLVDAIARINALLDKFETYSFYHIKRDLNSDADHGVKEGALLRQGVIKVNGSTSLHHIP
jgi:hypothetical protein